MTAPGCVVMGPCRRSAGWSSHWRASPTMSRLENTVKAIDLNPGSVRALTGAAIAFLESGNPEGALSPLNQSTTFQPEISVIYYLRAAVNSELGEQWRFKGSFLRRAGKPGPQISLEVIFYDCAEPEHFDVPCLDCTRYGFA